MLQKIKKSFGRRINFGNNQVSEFTDADDLRSVNSAARKPNKEFKKGRKKG